MDTENKATGQERPPLGSEEAISAVVEALSEARANKAVWDGPFFKLRRVQELEKWTVFLYASTSLDFQPHYLEIVEALRTLRWVQVTVPGRSATPEDLERVSKRTRVLR